jgi:hypothetical protein
VSHNNNLKTTVSCVFEYFIEFSEEKDGGMDTTPLKDKLGSSVINK